MLAAKVQIYIGKLVLAGMIRRPSYSEFSIRLVAEANCPIWSTAKTWDKLLVHAIATHNNNGNGGKGLTLTAVLIG